MRINDLFFIVLLFGTAKASTQTQSISIQVSQSSDDAEESEDALDILLESSDLELVYDDFSDQFNQTVGIRFTDVFVPTNAIIQNAYIQFYADDTGNEQTNLTIRGEASASSQTFINSPGNISSRDKTSASVEWNNVPPWTITHLGGEDERTPDLSELVSEMISNNGWTYGSPLTFIITGSGSREAESFDGTQEEAATLLIDYTLPAIDYDLGIDEVRGVDKFMLPQDDVQISTDITNYGLNPVDSFSISYRLSTGSQALEFSLEALEPNDTYTHTFEKTFNLVNLGSYSLEIEVSQENDITSFNNSMILDFEVVPEFSDLYFDNSSAWKYLDDGTDLGADWIDSSFDDTDWTLGAGEFGFGDGGETTLLEKGSITYYFRKQVEIEDIDLISHITANITSDDAIVLYVNGQEVSRSPDLPEGMITSSTTPDRDVPHDFENKAVPYKLDPSLFTNGINTLAIELHNLSATDNDLSFNCEIVNQEINYSMDGPYVFYEGDEMKVKNITSDGLQVSTHSSDATPTLTCDLPNGDSFSFDLIGNHEIPESEYEIPKKFLVTSDIEGQIEAYIFQLQKAEVIDENYNWIYGDGHLYFIGDLFDRGNYVTQCLWLLYKLEQEAKEEDGQVHFIIGNHEVLNFNFDFRYVTDKYFENAHYMGEMLYDLYDENTELGRWLRSKNILENAGSSAILVHAGLSPQVQSLNLSYDQINDYGQNAMNGFCPDDPCQIVNGGSDEGVYWYRGIAEEELTQAQVDDIINSFDGEKMIFGHTVFPQVTTIYDDKVIAIDVNHGNNFASGYMEALYYEDGCYYRQTTNANGLFLTSLDTDCSPVSTLELNSTLNLNIEPTIFKNELTIECPENLKEGRVKVYNIYGHLIERLSLPENQNQIRINTSEWKAGSYFISLESKDQTITRKAMKP